MVIVPAAQGWQWVVRGFALFRRSPILWMLVVVSYWMLIALLGLIPFVGALAATICIPPFSVSFMVICRSLDGGGRIDPAMLFAGFRENLPALLRLGVAYLFALAALLAATALVDGGHLARLLLTGERPAPDAQTGRSILNAALLALLLYTPVLAAFWYSPVLAAWQGMGMAKALFYSFFAMLRNWRAFLVYGLAVGAVGVLAPGLFLTLAEVFFKGSQPILSALPSFVALFFVAFMPTLFSSFYASYVDVFPPEPPAPDAVATDAETTSQ
jgi:hypothetical protein